MEKALTDYLLSAVRSDFAAETEEGDVPTILASVIEMMCTDMRNKVDRVELFTADEIAYRLDLDRLDTDWLLRTNLVTVYVVDRDTKFFREADVLAFLREHDIPCNRLT